MKETNQSTQATELRPTSSRRRHESAMDPHSRRHATWQQAVYLSCIITSPALWQISLPSPRASPVIDPISGVAPAQTVRPPEELPRHILGIIPNYRSDPNFSNSKPLRASQKFKLAGRDSFDPGTLLLTGMFAGISQNSRSVPTYGQGIAGYGRYYGSTYGDFMAGNFMTEAVYPSLLHQDPRYFRRGKGSAWSRLGYAIGQIFVTHGDNRKTQFNVSEIGGNATAVALSNAYNPDNRTASDAAVKLGIQVGLDMAGNILKEFAPDLHRKLRGSHGRPSSQVPTH